MSHTGITGLEGLPTLEVRVPVIDLTGPPLPIEYALHVPEALAPRHERALPEGVHHVYCTKDDCREALSRGRARYVGALGPGSWAQCRKCGTWYEGPAA